MRRGRVAIRACPTTARPSGTGTTYCLYLLLHRVPVPLQVRSRRTLSMLQGGVALRACLTTAQPSGTGTTYCLYLFLSRIPVLLQVRSRLLLLLLRGRFTLCVGSSPTRTSGTGPRYRLYILRSQVPVPREARLCPAVVPYGTRSLHNLIQASGAAPSYAEHRDLHGGLVLFDDSLVVSLPEYFNIRCHHAILSGGRTYDSVWVWLNPSRYRFDPLRVIPAYRPLPLYSLISRKSVSRDSCGFYPLYAEHRYLHGALGFVDDSVRFSLPEFLIIRFQQAITSGGLAYDSVGVWSHTYRYQSDPLPALRAYRRLPTFSLISRESDSGDYFGFYLLPWQYTRIRTTCTQRTKSCPLSYLISTQVQKFSSCHELALTMTSDSNTDAAGQNDVPASSTPSPGDPPTAGQTSGGGVGH